MRYVVLVMVAFASSSAYLTRQAFGPATDLIEADLQISSAQMGWVFSIFALGYFICQVPAGWLANRFGSRLVFPAISVLWSLTAVWMSLAGSFFSMAAARFVFGNAQAGLVPISARVIRDWMPENRRGMASALVGAAMSQGGVVTVALTGSLLAADWDWRTILQAYSVVGIVWAVIFYVVSRTRPEDHPLVNEAELQLIRGGEVTTQDTYETANSSEDSSILPAAPEPLLETPSPVEADDLTTTTTPPAADAGQLSGDSPSVTWAMFASLAMWGICLQSFFRAAAYQLLVTFYPRYLMEGYGLSKEAAAHGASYALQAVVIGSLVGGLVVDLIFQLTGSQRASRTGTGFIALLSCGMLTGIAGMGLSSDLLIVLVAAGALFAGLGNPPAWAATMDVAGDYTAEVMGVMNMAGTVGGFVFPILLGYMIDHITHTDGNWDSLLWVTAVTYLLGAASWLIVNPRRPLVDAG